MTADELRYALARHAPELEAGAYTLATGYGHLQLDRAEALRVGELVKSLLERKLARLEAPAKRKGFRAPYPAGFVDSATGRVAVLVTTYAASELNGDASAYWYDEKAEEWGADPWRLVDGVEQHSHTSCLDVCFANGSTLTVGPHMTLFVSAAHAAKINAT